MMQGLQIFFILGHIQLFSEGLRGLLNADLGCKTTFLYHGSFQSSEGTKTWTST